MAVKIRALQSLASCEYGKLRPGEIGYCKPSTAKYLIEKGMAEIVEENVEAPAKEVKPFIQIGNYQPKEQSQPVLYQPEINEKSEAKEDPEKAAGKKEITEDEKEKKEVKETPKKHYK